MGKHSAVTYPEYPDDWYPVDNTDSDGQDWGALYDD